MRNGEDDIRQLPLPGFGEEDLDQAAQLKVDDLLNITTQTSNLVQYNKAQYNALH